MVGAQSDNEASCHVLVDWDYDPQFSEESGQHLSFVHRYRITFDPNFESGESPSALTVDAVHRDSNGNDLLINFTFISAGGEVDIILDSTPSFGDSVFVSISSTEASCAREITITNWNQPVEDHEITRETTWSMEGLEDEEQGIEFEGRGWQKRTGNTLESNELGNGSMHIDTMDEDTNGLIIDLNLNRVWLNETYDGQLLTSQEFEMIGNGSMLLRDGYAGEQGGDGISIHVNVGHASILRSWSDGKLTERLVIDGNGWVSFAGGDNESSGGGFGSIEVFYFETWDVDGSRRLENLQLEANASIRLMGASDYFTFELEEFKIREKWEDDTRVDQFFKAAGSGEFAFEIEDEGFQVDVNGTVPIVHLESSGGETLHESIIVDGTYDGDAEGSFGYVRQIVDSGPQENFNGTLFEVNKIQDEFWFNVSATPFGPIDQEFGAEHNLTYEFTVPQEDWLNRTVRYQFVEDNGSVSNEYPEDSPIISHPERPQANPMFSNQISRETGFAPENVVVGDMFALSGNAEAILEVEVIGFTQRTVDGHADVEVAQWVGEYGSDSYASGFVINEGPLSGLLSEVFRWMEIDFSDGQSGNGTLSFVENQVVDRILYPSVITEEENTLPSVESVGFREGILLTEGGSAHLQISVIDVDTDVMSVTADLSFLGLGVVSLSDSGLFGDAVIHDDIWTIELTHSGLQYGEYEVSIVIQDYWDEVAESHNISITNAPPRVLSVSFSPSFAKRGEAVSVSVVASDGHGVSDVSVDLLSAGGDLTPLYTQSTGSESTWEGQFTVPYSLSPGARVIPLRLTDGEGETTLESNPASLPLLEIENEFPTLESIEIWSEGEVQTTTSDEGVVKHLIRSPSNDVSIPHTLEVVVNDPDGVSSVQAKIGRLADIGKSTEWLLLVDDGTSGDRIPGDGIYTLEFNVRPTVPQGVIEVQIRASDIFFATTPLEDQTHTLEVEKSTCCSGGGSWLSQNAGTIAAVSISILLIVGLAAILLSIRKSDFD